MDYIEVSDASVHNLKDVSLKIPRHRLVVVTGLSGSGKSSLAFDTIYAEARRRYMDTLSAYARHYIGVMERPEVESINGLSPTIAIEQKSTNRNPRSTVGTVTEISDFLRLLYARASIAYSPVTGKPMARYSDTGIVDIVIRDWHGRRCLILSPLVKGRKGHYRDLFESLLKKGYANVRVDGEIRPLGDLAGGVDRYKVHFIELVVDRLVPKEEDRKRITASVQTALNLGKGSLAVMDVETGAMRHLSKHFICPESGISFPEPAPHTFSFNSPEGACPYCKGLGTYRQMDISKLIPDRSLSIAGGGIVPLGVKRDNAVFTMLEAVARKYSFSLFDPIAKLPDGALDTVLYGTDDLVRVDTVGGLSEMMPFPGVLSRIEKKDTEEYGEISDRYSSESVCPHCHGTRLKESSLYFRIAGMNIAEVSDLDISELYDWVCSLGGKLDPRQKTIAEDIIKELRDRISFLKDVGLSYLSLNRTTRSLSGGESQRIRLATQIGSRLVNVLYILDEPSIGLHQSDNMRLINSLKKLRDEGNSVMVVEHDEEMMRNADWIVDLGPGAGEQGGRLLYSGPVDGLAGGAADDPDGAVFRDPSLRSYTAEYISGIARIVPPAARRKGNGLHVTLRGACGNNLKNVDISIPLGCLVGISGVSGSGKSSLVNDTLMPIISNRLYRSAYTPLKYDSIEGLENIDKLVEVDQSPIGRSPRSNPATYTGVLTPIRKLFEETPDARIRGFKSNKFSFNVKGGRCEACKGAGVEVIEMNFLPSVSVKCKECNGRRFKPEVLAVKYKGKSISDVLDMTVSAAVELFGNIPSIAQKLKSLEDVGLGYVRLGQSSLTLSGGENQRVKLASELSRNATGRSLYILDEPTTGLHTEDIKILLSVLQKLVDQGNTVIIIEHNLDVLKSVDYLFDMGPGGGRNGGMIVSEGTPEEVACDTSSVTGAYLKPLLDIKH